MVRCYVASPELIEALTEYVLGCKERANIGAGIITLWADAAIPGWKSIIGDTLNLGAV